MRKSFLTVGIAAAVLAAGAPVCADETPTEVTLLHYFTDIADAHVIESWVEEYNELQNDIHITCSYASREELVERYTAGADSGQLPDIGMVDSPDMAAYIKDGVFENITEQLNEWGETDQFYEGPLSSCMDAGGDLYGLPQNSSCLALGVNMDLLRAAGYDHVPESLDEFQEMVAAATDEEAGVYGFTICAADTEEGTFQLLPWLCGTLNGESTNVDNLTAASAVNGLTVLSDFVKNGYLSENCVYWSQGDSLDEFISGRAVFAELGTWHLAQTDAMDFDYQFCLLPTGDKGTSSSTIGGENFGVCKGAKDVDGCAAFLEWLCSKEKTADWALKTGKIPTRKDVSVEYPYEQEGFKVFTEAMNYAKARGPHPEWPTISEAIRKAAYTVLANNVDPAQALKTADETIAPIIAENPLPQ